MQQARNVLMWLEEQGLEASYLIHDRDTMFLAAFDQLLRATSVQMVKSPVMAQNANAYAESWIATVRRECLDHFACFSLGHVDHLVQVFAGYYNRHRPHQGLGNRVLSQPNTPEL
ncbi:MAG: integrase core domain-containing protein [Planctomycetota bacterium]